MLRYRPTHRTPRVTRGRVIALTVGAAGLSVLLVAGLVLSAIHVVHRPWSRPETTSSARNSRVSAEVERARDELAARAMPDTGTGHEFGWPQLSTRDPGPAIQLPPARGVDGLGVALGFPQTPQGALAQLAAIEAAALESRSLPGVRAVIRAWGAPGGPTTRSWSGITAMTSLLGSARLPATGSPHLSITVTPAMGLVKGRIGDDFVVACVDLSVDITYGATTTTVSADCQRMLWQGDRWLIGPGAEPAPVPQVWPGTDAAINSGFRDLVLN